VDSEISRLQKKVENYPSPSAYNRLAELLRVSGDAERAEAVCRRCIKEFPRNGQAYVLQANVEVGRGQRGEAVRLLREGIANDPRCYGGLRMLAELCVEDRELDQAVGLLQRILEFRPQDEQVRSRVGELQQRLAGGFNQNEAPKPAAAETSTDEDTIDLSQMGSLTTATRPTRRPTPPPRALARVSAGSAGGPLNGLVSQDGVRGAVIADSHGRSLSEQGLPDGTADLLAALANDVSSAADAVKDAIGGDKLISWTIIADQGQAVCYRRDGDDLTLAALADTSVKAALLELRARQALIDLGAG
jgi:predicted regulator of Ras-like GTPase activity (Roadblock/LC7/MglB family)